MSRNDRIAFASSIVIVAAMMLFLIAGFVTQAMGLEQGGMRGTLAALVTGGIYTFARVFFALCDALSRKPAR